MGILLNPRLWIAAAIVAVLAFTHVFTYRAGKSVVRLEWADADREISRNNRKLERNLVDSAVAQRRTTDEKVSRIAAERDRAVDELRMRPERTVESPTTAATCTGQTGQSLARGDAEFLVRYSADAARLQAAVEQCEAQYESARKALAVER